MKRLLCLFSFCVAFTAQAALVSWDSGFATGGNVDDGTSTGWSDTRTLSGFEGSITDVNVTLSLSGGYNGDLYVYLSHGGQISVLMNRVGRTATTPFGYGDAGLNITFNDQASQTIDIHGYQSVTGFSISGGAEWRPDSRFADPRTVVDTVNATAFLSSFNGLNANGAWTLFIADLSGGGISHVDSWGIELEVSAVPEPVNVSLAIFALLGVVLITVRFIRHRAV